MKICGDCGEAKALEEFGKNRRMLDGLYAYCKACVNRKNRERYARNPEPYKASSARDREKNPDRIAAYLKDWRKAHPDDVRRYAEEHAERHPDKAAARWRLKQAVQEGRVEKPDVCADCAETFDREELDGHHSDYEKPFDVAWLCHPCHVERHKKEGTYAWHE